MMSFKLALPLSIALLFGNVFHAASARKRSYKSPTRSEAGIVYGECSINTNIGGSVVEVQQHVDNRGRCDGLDEFACTWDVCFSSLPDFAVCDPLQHCVLEIEQDFNEAEFLALADAGAIGGSMECLARANVHPDLLPPDSSQQAYFAVIVDRDDTNKQVIVSQELRALCESGLNVDCSGGINQFFPNYENCAAEPFPNRYCCVCKDNDATNCWNDQHICQTLEAPPVQPPFSSCSVVIITPIDNGCEGDGCFNPCEGLEGLNCFEPVRPPRPTGGPETGGDPHFKTWNGEWYDYHGECELVLLNAPNFADGLGLDIHIRTMSRGSYSIIESAAVRIGDDTLEVASFGDHFLNGVLAAELPTKIAGGSMTVTHSQMNSVKQHEFLIMGTDGTMITIKTFKDLVTVKIGGIIKDKDYAGSVGMLGSYEEGAMLARDGVTLLTDSPNDFGAEWQVREEESKLFRQLYAPQYPQVCKLPDHTKQASRRLGETIAELAAEVACAHWGDRKEMCKYDVLKTGDLELAEAGPM